VFFDEMDALFRTRGTGISSDLESTIVPQFLAEIDGMEQLNNVIVIGASNRQDLIDPAVLRQGRLDLKIKIDRPNKDGATDIFTKYLTTDLPFHVDELNRDDQNAAEVVTRMIVATVDAMYSLSEENRFLEVTYVNGSLEIFYLKDFVSGAFIEGVVSRAKKTAIKRFLATGEKGLKEEDLLHAAREEFKEQEDLPNTTNPDDWAKIAGRKNERIVHVRTLTSTHSDDLDIESIPTGHYLERRFWPCVFTELRRNSGLPRVMAWLSILLRSHCFLSTTILCSRLRQCCGITKGKALCRTAVALKWTEKLSVLGRITIGS
jgi:proteasome-associated ATPase